MAKCKNIGDCTTPGSCFGTFGACLNETTDERRKAWDAAGERIHREDEGLPPMANNENTRAPASAPLPLTDERFKELVKDVWKRGGFAGTPNLDDFLFARAVIAARECLAAAPVADDLQEAARGLVGWWDSPHPEHEAFIVANLQAWIDRLRAALSGGSPEPVSGSEGEEEGAGR